MCNEWISSAKKDNPEDDEESAPIQIGQDVNDDEGNEEEPAEEDALVDAPEAQDSQQT